MFIRSIINILMKDIKVLDYKSIVFLKQSNAIDERKKSIPIDHRKNECNQIRIDYANYDIDYKPTTF